MRLSLKLSKMIDDIWNYVYLKHHKVEYGNNLKINGRVQVIGSGSVIIGDNVVINSGINHNPIGGDIRTVLYAINGGKIIVGEGTGISNSSIVTISDACINIGKNVLIGASCKIWASDFHAISYSDRLEKKNVKHGSITIKDGTFIGGGCTILKNVTIGSNVVIGAGSVVTHDVPDGEIWGGNPARFIRKNS